MKATLLLIGALCGCSMSFSARTGPEKRHCYTFEEERLCFETEEELRADYRARQLAKLREHGKREAAREAERKAYQEERIRDAEGDAWERERAARAAESSAGGAG